MNERTIKGMRAPDLRALIEETVNKINKIETALESIEQQKRQASESRIEISGGENTKGILGEVKALQTEANEKINLIRDIYTELLGDEEDENDLGIKEELDNLLQEFHSTKEKIESAEKELFGYEKKTDEGEKHVDGLMEKIKNFFEIQKKKYAETYDKIENELLAGATTVGLSKAYTDKAASYTGPNILWLIGFFLSITVIIVILGISLNDVQKIYFKIPVDNSESTVESILNTDKLLEYLIIKLVINIGIISSLIWVASFTGKRYSQNKRLSEEYSYKATFAKSFEGYRKRAEEIDQVNDNSVLSEKLMDKMIEISAFNPVQTMESKSHKEGHPTIKILENSLAKSIETIEKSVNIIDKMKN
ncbi:MAG: hypothetical protein AB7J46_04825 [Candidatus Altimarinota bacterium]